MLLAHDKDKNEAFKTSYLPQIDLFFAEQETNGSQKETA